MSLTTTAGPSVSEDTHARTCDECDATTQATVERTRLASDHIEERWVCKMCGRGHDLKLED